MLMYFVFGTRREEDSDWIIADYKTIGSISGIDVVHRNNSIGVFLRKFSSDVVPLIIRPYSMKYKMARTVFVKWPSDVQKVINEEYSHNYDHLGRCYLNGSAFTKVKLRQNTMRAKQDALSCFLHRNNKEARSVLSYFNNLPSHLFTNILVNMPETINYAKEHNDTNSLRILHNINDQPKPYIKTVEHSARLYQTEENLMMLQGELRRILTKNWREADLKSCQFAIAASVWNTPKTLDFLKSGKDIWKHLCKYIGIEKTPEVKGYLKHALYALLYGGQLYSSVANYLRPIGADALDKVLKSPIIDELYKERDRQIRIIKKNAGATDIYGSFIPLNENNSENSILAQLNQAIEFKILYPAFNLAQSAIKSHNGFYICLYQFDGFSFMSKKPGWDDYWMDTLKYKVDQEANRLGIFTSLEI